MNLNLPFPPSLPAHPSEVHSQGGQLRSPPCFTRRPFRESSTPRSATLASRPTVRDARPPRITDLVRHALLQRRTFAPAPSRPLIEDRLEERRSSRGALRRGRRRSATSAPPRRSLRSCSWPSRTQRVRDAPDGASSRLGEVGDARALPRLLARPRRTPGPRCATRRSSRSRSSRPVEPTSARRSRAPAETRTTPSGTSRSASPRSGSTRAAEGAASPVILAEARGLA